MAASALGERCDQVAGLHYVVRQPCDVPPPWPMLLFLHGAGERGDANGQDLYKVKIHGPWKGPGAEVFIIVAPQCPTGSVWPALTRELRQVVDRVMSEVKVDRSRVYVTGLSMGGFGAWAVADAYPDLPAAVLPICGAFTPPVDASTGLAALLSVARNTLRQDDVKKVRQLPAWIFHGEKDKTVDVNGSRSAFAALGGQSRGDALRLKLFPDAGHNCWGSVYRDPEVYRWLLRHRRSAAGAAGTLSSLGFRAIPPQLQDLLALEPLADVPGAGGAGEDVVAQGASAGAAPSMATMKTHVAQLRANMRSGHPSVRLFGAAGASGSTAGEEEPAAKRSK